MLPMGNVCCGALTWDPGTAMALRYEKTLSVSWLCRIDTEFL